MLDLSVVALHIIIIISSSSSSSISSSSSSITIPTPSRILGVLSELSLSTGSVVCPTYATELTMATTATTSTSSATTSTSSATTSTSSKELMLNHLKL